MLALLLACGAAPATASLPPVAPRCSLFGGDARTTPSGQLLVLAGVLGRAGGVGGRGGWPAQALLKSPQGAVVDRNASAIYIADTGNHVVRIVGIDAATDPVVAKTLAGSLGRPGASGDLGLAVDARLRAPKGLVLDPEERLLFIADSGNHAVRLVDLSERTIVTIAGSLGRAGASGDGGLSTEAMLRSPSAVAFDAARRLLFVSDTANHAVRVVDLASGIINTLAGTLGMAGVETAVAPGGIVDSASAPLNFPRGLALDTTKGHLYIADSGNHAIRRIDLNAGRITTLACRCAPPLASTAGALGVEALPGMASAGGRLPLLGASSQGARDDGAAAEARLRQPSGLALDVESDILYISDSAMPVIRRLHLPSMTISLLVSRPGYYDARSEDGGQVGLAFDEVSHQLIMAEAMNNVVRRFDVPNATGASPQPADGLCL